jgi:hypothetical protein
MMTTVFGKKRVREKGQALVESLMVLPVILLLLIAASDMGRLFVISGKSEIAARYAALRNTRGEPFEPKGMLYPEPVNDEQVGWIFFEGSLGDASNVIYESFPWQIIPYVTPDTADSYLDGVLHLRAINPISGRRIGFEYNFPLFPYGKPQPFKGATDTDLENAGFKGTEDSSFYGLGPYPFITTKGDFVVISDSYAAGDTAAAIQQFLRGALSLTSIPFTAVEFTILIRILLGIG